jgi:Mitochondrial ribosomal protein L31
MPREEEMLPKDKYSIFDRKEKKYRKGIHSEWWFFASFTKSLTVRAELPKWTRVSQRINPPGF